MNKILLIARKEFRRRFTLSLIVGAVFGVLSASLATALGGWSPLLSFGVSALTLNFALFLLGASIVAEERSRGTLPFLLTLPLRDIEIALGKLLGLAAIISPAIAVNFAVVSFALYGGSPSLNYLLSLSLYLLFSASLLLMTSAQFQRLPAIFLAFIFYNFVLAFPGAYWLSEAVVTPEPAPVLPAFLLVFSFFTPIFFGAVEYISLKLESMAPQLVAAGGPGGIITILKELPGDSAFSQVNFFSPLWQSSMLRLQESGFFTSYPHAGAFAVVSILAAVCILCGLSALQLRKGKRVVFPLFLLFALSPALGGFFAPPQEIEIASEMEELGEEPEISGAFPGALGMIQSGSLVGIDTSARYPAGEGRAVYWLQLTSKAAGAP